MLKNNVMPEVKFKSCTTGPIVMIRAELIEMSIVHPSLNFLLISLSTLVGYVARKVVVVNYIYIIRISANMLMFIRLCLLCL